MENDKSTNNDSISISSSNPNKRDALFDSCSDSIPKKSKTDTTQQDKTTNTNLKIENNNDKLLFVIEADGAEDKGSRHTMEDKFVVFPDATLYSPPGTLRFSRFFFLFCYIILFVYCTPIYLIDVFDEFCLHFK